MNCNVCADTKYINDSFGSHPCECSLTATTLKAFYVSKGMNTDNIDFHKLAAKYNRIIENDYPITTKHNPPRF